LGAKKRGRNIEMKLVVTAAAIAAGFLLAGCQTAQPPSTASGKAEVTIKAPVGAIKSAIISRAINVKYSVTKDTEYLLQMEKPSDNFGAALLLGSKYDSVPAERAVFTFAPQGDTVRVVAALMYVTNPGSGFERLTPVNAGEGVDRTQASLYEIKDQLETPPPAPAASRPKPRTASTGAKPGT
jgi:hypothetical protein